MFLFFEMHHGCRIEKQSTVQSQLGGINPEWSLSWLQPADGNRDRLPVTSSSFRVEAHTTKLRRPQLLVGGLCYTMPAANRRGRMSLSSNINAMLLFIS